MRRQVAARAIASEPMRSLIVAACVAVPVLAAQGRPSPAPPPLGAWTPVPELPGMGRPVDTASVAARRRALLARIGRGVVLLPAAHERELEGDYVQDNDFRQSNTFFYFTELETQDAWLLLVAGGVASETVLFLPPRADSMRLEKDDDEIARMRKAVDISVLGHVAAMQAARPGVWEYEIEAVLEAAFRRNGADRVGYPSIVGSGPNSTTLHYDVSRRQTRDGDLVVVDAGAEWGQYTADVTRTFPVNGKFTPRQKEIYDLVLATQQAAFDSTRPGTTIAQLNRVARAYMRTHSGTLCGAETCDAYFIHGLSHWLG